MKLASCVLALLAIQAVYGQKGGCGRCPHYTSDRVTIIGTAAWGSVQPVQIDSNYYVIASTPDPITAVGISGDPHFTINSAGCVGGTSCSATVSFSAPVGGDYSATISASAAGGGLVLPGNASEALIAHVVGANYTLVNSGVVSNNNSDVPALTVTVALNSTGETDLHLTGVTATDLYNGNGASITSNTCVGTIAHGTSCKIVIHYRISAIGDDTAAYGMRVAVTGDTRAQPPLQITGVVSLGN